jgi:protocatechuate 3,4-dioxygenase beta subunit
MSAAHFLLLALLFGTQQQTSTIEGMVMRADGGGPVAKARVYLSRRSDGGNGAYATMSGGDGRFVLKDVPPGKYVLIAKQTGYLDAEYGAKTPRRPGALVDISPGVTLRDRNVRMTAGSVVTGRVLDQNGKPLPSASVQLLQPRYTPEGRATPTTGFSTSTNDLGEYRIFWVSPGTYYLAVSVNDRSLMLDPMERYRGLVINEQYAGNEEIYLPTYYPNSPDISTATPIQVGAGAEVRGIDVAVVPVPTVRIRGSVVDAASGAPAPNIEVWVRRKQDGWGNQSYSAAVNASRNGEFDIRRVPAGALYTIGANTSRPGPQPNMLRTEMELQVGDKDIPDLRLLLRPRKASEIHGRVTFDTNAAPRPMSLRLEAINGSESSGGVGIQAGNFTTSPSPGVFRVGLSAAEGYFIRSARSGTRDVLRDGIDSTEGPPEPLEIVIGYSTAAVEGAVTQEDGKPVTGAQVVLIPRSLPLFCPELFRTAVTDQFGRFSIRGVAPGSYSILALDDIEPYSYFDPAFVQPYKSRALTIAVDGSGTLTANLVVIN